MLPSTIKRFREAHSGASFVVRDAVADRVAGMVREEEVDIGVMGGMRRGADIDVLFEKQERLLVVFPENHRLGNCRSIGIEEIAACPIVMLDSATSVRNVVESAFLNAGKTINAACEATYMMTAVGMVSAGSESRSSRRHLWRSAHFGGSCPHRSKMAGLSGPYQ